MPADRSEIKQVDYAFSENGNVNFHIFELLDYLNNLNSCLSELDELLTDGGIDGIDHKNFGEDIEYSCEMLMDLIRYSGSAKSAADSLIDLPLYEGFNHHATEALSRINLDDYSIDNNLGIYQLTHNNINMMTRELKDSLKLEDFIGLTSFGVEGALITVPDEFRQFTDIYSGFYESYKESMTDEEGNLISLEEYLEMLAKSGEFSHKMNKPFLSLLENITDMLIIPPIIEAITGYEILTGEDLSAFERGMKGASAIVCVCSYGNSLVHMSMSVGGITSEKLLAAGVKELTSNTVTYLVGYSCDELGLPVPICIVIAVSSGVAVDTALDDALLGVLDSYNISRYDLNIQKPIDSSVISDSSFYRGLNNSNNPYVGINSTSLDVDVTSASGVQNSADNLLMRESNIDFSSSGLNSSNVTLDNSIDLSVRDRLDSYNVPSVSNSQSSIDIMRPNMPDGNMIESVPIQNTIEAPVITDPNLDIASNNFVFRDTANGYQRINTDMHVSGGTAGYGRTHSRWWHEDYVDDLSDLQTILGVQQTDKGMYTLGSSTRENAMSAGEAWVGENYNIISDRNGNIIGYSSEDGMRAFRIQYKPQEGMVRANFTENMWVNNRYPNPGQHITILKNVHIDIIE